MMAEFTGELVFLALNDSEIWIHGEKTISARTRLFIVEGVRGGESVYKGINDICIDDFSVMAKECGCKL